MPDLELTDEITDLGAAALKHWPIHPVDAPDAASEVLQAAGPALVAAELRRLADRIGGTDYGRVAAQVLHQRANELHPNT